MNRRDQCVAAIRNLGWNFFAGQLNEPLMRDREHLVILDVLQLPSS